MTDGQNAEGQDSRYCGARTRSGGRCRRPAGWGTDHAGVPGTTCKLHLGATRNHQAAAERVAAEQVVARFGLDLDGTPPGQAILREIRRSSAMVGQLAAEVSELTTEERTWGVASRRIRPAAEPGAQPMVEVEQRARIHPLVVMLRDERKTLRELFEAAHHAGIEERQVALAERDGNRIFALLEGVLAEFRLAFRLTAAQQAQGREIVRRQLLAIVGGE